MSQGDILEEAMAKIGGDEDEGERVERLFNEGCDGK